MIAAMTMNAGKSSERRLRKHVIRIALPKPDCLTCLQNDGDDVRLFETGIIASQAHHPFTAPMVRPDWKNLLAYRNNSIKGIEMTTAVAAK